MLKDEAYDVNTILKVQGMGAEAVIPPRANRLESHAYDQELHQERHLVECFLGKLTHFRRIFSRFDKLACNYLAFLYFASTLIWLRGKVNRT